MGVSVEGVALSPAVGNDGVLEGLRDATLLPQLSPGSSGQCFLRGPSLWQRILQQSVHIWQLAYTEIQHILK